MSRNTTVNKGGKAAQFVMLFCCLITGILSLVGVIFIAFVCSRSNTIGSNVLDYTITTPATVFLFYGLPSIVVSGIGMFASISAHPVATAAFFLIGTLFLVVDATFGIDIFFGHNAYHEFIERMHQSQNRYGEANAKPFGVFPFDPTEFWDHLQRRGQCCGMNSYEEWRYTTFGNKTSSIPDSCCNAVYDYKGCGYQFWKHQDNMHPEASIVNIRGCLTLFPESLQGEQNGRINIIAKIMASCFVPAICLSCILWILVVTGVFKKDEGLNNPTFRQVPLVTNRRISEVNEDVEEGQLDDSNNNSSRPRRISIENTPNTRGQKSRRRSSGSGSGRHVRTA